MLYISLKDLIFHDIKKKPEKMNRKFKPSKKSWNMYVYRIRRFRL